MSEKLSIIQTSDGSQTIRNNLTGDTYHSVHGAIQESNHVFIRHGLEYYIQSFQKNKVRILEVGLGTALNPLLTENFISSKNIEVEYLAVEAFPLEREIFSKLDFGFNQPLLLLFHECKWENEISIGNKFRFSKTKIKLEEAQFPANNFDLIYFDAFAPASQPELWTLDIFKKIISWSTLPLVFTTYCAKGDVKRALISAGFDVEKLPGPPGKREMIRAKII